MATDASLRDRIQQLEGEVERLQQQLGDLHCTDLNSLRRAYHTLCQHIEALEQESEGLLGDLRGLETDVLTPDVIATELGAVSCVTVGLALTHQAFKITPLATAGWLLRGMWALGGAYIAWRLTAGTLARIAGMLGRNSRRKRSLEAKLQAVEDRIRIMVSLLSWSDAKGMPPPTASQAALHQLLYPASLQDQHLPRQERQLQPWLVSPPQAHPQEQQPSVASLQPAGQQQGAPSQAQRDTAPAASPASLGLAGGRSDSLSSFGSAKSSRSRSSQERETPTQAGAASGVWRSNNNSAAGHPPQSVMPPSQSATAGSSAGPGAALVGSTADPRMPNGSHAAVHAEAPALGSHLSSSHSRSTSHTSVASQQLEGSERAEQGTGGGKEDVGSGPEDVDKGTGGNSSSRSSSIQASASSRASSGSSPGRVRVQLELEPLMRYAQLGSRKGASPPGGA